jgi:hypothetical protein
VKWETVVAAATGCFSVSPDNRTSPDGTPKHPDGYVILCRVLVPGGLLRGTDSTPNVRWRLFHILDTCVPVDPATFPQRLEAAGFIDAGVVTRPGGGLSFRGRKPA